MLISSLRHNVVFIVLLSFSFSWKMAPFIILHSLNRELVGKRIEKKHSIQVNSADLWIYSIIYEVDNVYSLN